MADFLIKAIVAGLLVAAVAGPLGCFVVWRRMAFFGDTLAHSALLGISLGILADINLQLSVIIACGVLAILLVGMEKNQTLGSDTLLGILAHSSLAIGLVILSFTNVQVDLMAYLFGDLLTVSGNDILWIVASTLVVLIVMGLYWNQFLSITLHAELSQVEGLKPERLRLVLMLLMALVVAVSMKIIGILLITSLLIIPPACARAFAGSPERMALLASLFGCISVIAGISASWWWDTPTGPSIVVAAALIFSISRLPIFSARSP